MQRSVAKRVMLHVGETNTLVTELVDIDRTPELLTWIFGSMLGGGASATDRGATQVSGGRPMNRAPCSLCVAMPWVCPEAYS